jgi:DNA repair protein RadC
MGFTIHELPPEDRPREKLMQRGAAALSDSELIAILLRTGIPGANAVAVAQTLLREYGSLSTLARCSVQEIAKIKGVGPAKAVQLAAAFGLGARLARESASETPLDQPSQIYALLGREMRALRQESLRVVLLDTKYRLLRVEEISLGSLNESIAHPREIFRPALIHSAYAIIVAHNHPSGDPTPSEADRRLTRRLKEAAELLKIPLLDHVIIGAPGVNGSAGYTSFRELGLL